MRPFRLFLCLSFCFPAFTHGSITVYYPPGQQALTTTASNSQYTGLQAYNPVTLVPPPLPSPMPAMQYSIQLVNQGTPGLSIKQSSFFGFSVEMSVANQVFGKNSTLLQVPFLNLMANIVQRAGHVRIRVGGNTQETAQMVDSLPDGKVLQKDLDNVSNPTMTPPLQFTTDLLYMMRNISSFVNVRWFVGVPFNDTSNIHLDIVRQGVAILGEYLIGVQVGNEPDYYVRHGHRPEGYGPFDYFGEFGALVNQIAGDTTIPDKSLLIAPGIAAGDWTPEQVWDTGLVSTYNENLAYLAVEHYPHDNCFARYGRGTPRDPQVQFPLYLTHDAGKELVSVFLNSTNYAQQMGKEMIMFETNSASCGGYPGVSDAYGAALWGLDYALQMAYTNFSGALFHIGGQNVSYNPFTPPPTNETTYHQWTIGPLYYSALVMAEALGANNESQVLDLNANSGSPYTPAYAIYQNGSPARLALFNYMDDSSGGSDLVVNIAVGGGSTGTPPAVPSSVKVKYLSAASVSQKGNITWAGQTFGDYFSSDGRPVGEEQISTVYCDTINNVCAIKVPAPSFALVFLTDESYTENEGDPSATFATSVHTRLHNTATVNKFVLATSNGNAGISESLGSTSVGSTSDEIALIPALSLLTTSVLAGALWVLRAV